MSVVSYRMSGREKKRKKEGMGEDLQVILMLLSTTFM
jgi:hypothetical protein